MSRFGNRLLSLILAASLVIGMAPVPVSALGIQQTEIEEPGQNTASGSAIEAGPGIVLPGAPNSEPGVDVSDHPLAEVEASDDEPLLAPENLSPRARAILGIKLPALDELFSSQKERNDAKVK